MRYAMNLLLIIPLLICPVIAVDTSNWINVTSNMGVRFEMPPNWAWDPIDQTTVGIRTDKSDAVLMISYIQPTPPISNLTDPDIGIIAKKELADLNVPNMSEVSYDNHTAIVSGITLDGTIINYREKYENDHFYRWVSEYSDNDAVIKYTDTMLTIIRSTGFINSSRINNQSIS